MVRLILVKTIILVRHGESEMNVAKITTNAIDKYPLTVRGRAQAKRLTQELTLVRPNVLFTSPVLRAVETAGIISQGLNIPAKVKRALVERDPGRLNGMKISTFEEDVDLYSHADQYGIEPVSSITRRVVEFMDGLSQGITIAVTHADIIRGALVHALGISDDEFSSYGILPETATMTVINQREGGRYEVVAIGSPRMTDSIVRACREG